MGWSWSSGSMGRIGADQDIAADAGCLDFGPVYDEAVYPTYNLGSN